MISLLCRVFFFNCINELIYKNRNRVTDAENKHMITKGDNTGRDKLGYLG